MKCEHVSPRVYAALTVVREREIVGERLAPQEAHHDEYIRVPVPECSEHCLGSAKVTGPPKRSLLSYERRLGDCNKNVLLSGT